MPVKRKVTHQGSLAGKRECDRGGKRSWNWNGLSQFQKQNCANTKKTEFFHKGPASRKRTTTVKTTSKGEPPKEKGDLKQMVDPRGINSGGGSVPSGAWIKNHG